MSTFAKKSFGTLLLVGIFGVTSFIGVSIANAQFELSGKNINFHAIVQTKSLTSYTLLTSSTDPITVGINWKTKFPKGVPGIGDVVYVVARINPDTSITALIIKRDKSGGVDDVYGTEGDNVTAEKVTMIPSTYPWLHVASPIDGTTEITFKVTRNTKYVGAKGFSDLHPGDTLSITGKDTSDNGFVAKLVIRHKGKDVHDEGRDGDKNDDKPNNDDDHGRSNDNDHGNNGGKNENDNKGR